MMSYDISTRVSLRWLPDPPSEPSDVLVYNVGHYFLDLRVLKADRSIQWAMAGEKQIISTEPLKCRWLKIIDSFGASEPDEASFTTLPNGDELETGSMPCPERGGAATKYEEVWRNLNPREGVEHAWILQSVDGNIFLGRIGGGYMALREGKREGFGARREEWDIANGWNVKYEIGSVNGVPSFAAHGKIMFDKEESWKVGNIITISGNEYIVRAWEDM
ncbi:hypothetical protein D0Z07_6491 [Hyphodiscus hymeniophilus]|uniref:Protein HRI1 n=1 Tax=Hyphodiscus hymeniophilus TaxID=353542 RepID=A0A9P6VFB7_9HELO|nr:hypothetical protein D0Z07_6491 [Hyphodiscus hymeniophilus]